MNPASEDVKDMIETESILGLLLANNLFIGKEPSTPKDCVTIFDTIGYRPELNLTSQGYEYPSIQIRVRNTDYMIGMDLIYKIKNLLHGRSHQIWNGSLYTVIYCSSGPALLDWDENGNARFIINFNLQRR